MEDSYGRTQLMFYLKHSRPSHSSSEYVLVQTIQISFVRFPTMLTETPPGFVLTTISNKVKFVTAFQNGEFSPELENLTDWTELMEIVGHSFDTLDDLGDVEESIQEDIISWLRLYEQVHSGIFDVKVSIEERGYFEDDVAGKRSTSE